MVTLRNGSDNAITHYPPHCPIFPPVPGKFCVQQGFSELAPHTTKRVDLLHSGAVFLYVSDDVFVQLRVHDLSRQAESFGAEIPVVRLSEMKTTPGAILDIPNDPRFRSTFRVYAFWPNAPSDLVVRFVNDDTGASREERFHIEPSTLGWDEPIAAPPLYRQFSDFEATRIELEPSTPGLRYWAFVSVTNNETQQVTTLTIR